MHQDKSHKKQTECQALSVGNNFAVERFSIKNPLGVSNMFKQTALVALTYITMPLVFANGIFQSVAGDVLAGVAGISFVVTPVNSPIAEGTAVMTGPSSRATLRLDAGHSVTLAENTEFVLTPYKFDRVAPVITNIAVQSLKGALRSFSGLIRGKNPASSP